MPPHIHTLVSIPFAENTYIIWLAGQTAALVVDPGTEPGEILSFLEERQLTPAAILNTHGHADHIAGNASLKQAFPDSPIVIGSGDGGMLTDPWQNLSAMFGPAITSPPADRVVREGDVLEYAGLTLEVREIPGHSPGHVVFIHRPEDGTPMVLGGDVLFRGSIGRTDFPGGSLELLLQGIREKLWPLPDTTAIYPGHGPVTTVGHERRTNPFAGEGAG